MEQIINIDSILEVKVQRQVPQKFRVTGYNEAGYMKMVNINNAFEGMTIHPEHARRIKECIDGDSGIKVLDCEALQDVHAHVVMSSLPTAEGTRKTIPTVSKTPRSGTTEPTKKERAAVIKAANPTLSRKEIIALFMSELNMTAAGASTYYSYK